MPNVSLPPYWIEHVYTTLAQSIDWGTELLGVPQLWSRSRGKGVRVAVLDTGDPSGHPDLIGAVVDARDFTRSHSGDRQGHSTHCCGVIAARDNDTGVVGIAPEAELLIGKVLSDSGSGSGAGVAAGVRWAVARHADVISMSLGSPVPDPQIQAAIAEALAAGIPVIAAAGNEGPGPNTVGYPAAFPGVVCVGAIDRLREVARFSSRGPRLDVVAPGADITSCWPDGGYRSLSGTSMATPAVAGVVALLIAARKSQGLPPCQPAELVGLLRRTAMDLGTPGPDAAYGYGLIDPSKLMPVHVPAPESGGSMSYFEILMWVVDFLKSDKGKMLMAMAQELVAWLISQKPASVADCEAAVQGFAVSKGLSL